LTAKEYLDGILAKYNKWEDLSHIQETLSMKRLFGSNSQYQKCKKDGVGEGTLTKFLGGNCIYYFKRILWYR